MQQRSNGPQIFLVLLLLAGLLAVIAVVSRIDVAGATAAGARAVEPSAPATPLPTAVSPEPAPRTTAPTPTPPASDETGPAPGPTVELPGGGTRVFAGNRLLVAYYGTARSAALGVLGEAAPARIVPRLRRAAKPFAHTGRPVQPVFELIVTVAHRHPGPRGTYSGDIRRADVRRYLRAAREAGALVVLDLQPGREDFLTVAKRWEWALEDPWVGLALDPEWRMGKHGVPGDRIGRVGAGEVNRVSAWLSDLVARERLPEKVLVLHQFRREMVRNIHRVKQRPGLAMVQHVDGFGTPKQKLATYHHVLRPKQFHPGFKLFYDEDVRRMSAKRVLRIRPRVDFVSFQ